MLDYNYIYDSHSIFYTSDNFRVVMDLTEVLNKSNKIIDNNHEF